VSPQAPAWTTKALSILLPIVGLDLGIQYIAGLGANAYAPASGFTTNTAFAVYNVHFLNAYVLGVLTLLLLIVAGFSRLPKNIAPAAVTFVAVLVAALTGMAFIRTTPNPPLATIAMGLAFLVAFAATLAWMVRLNMARPGGSVTAAPPAVPV
jgi:heme A synthase